MDTYRQGHELYTLILCSMTYRVDRGQEQFNRVGITIKERNALGYYLNPLSDNDFSKAKYLNTMFGKLTIIIVPEGKSELQVFGVKENIIFVLDKPKLDDNILSRIEKELLNRMELDVKQFNTLHINKDALVVFLNYRDRFISTVPYSNGITRMNFVNGSLDIIDSPDRNVVELQLIDKIESKQLKI